MIAHVQVDSDFAGVLGLEAESVHDFRCTVLVEVVRLDQFFQLVDSDGAAEEEGVDLGGEGASRSPGLHLKLVVAGLGREPDEAIALDAVSTPAVDGVDLKEQVGALLHLLALSQELEVEREREVTDILRSLHVVCVIDDLDCRLAQMSHRLPIDKQMMSSDPITYLLLCSACSSRTVPNVSSAFASSNAHPSGKNVSKNTYVLSALNPHVSTISPIRDQKLDKYNLAPT